MGQRGYEKFGPDYGGPVGGYPASLPLSWNGVASRVTQFNADQAARFGMNGNIAVFVGYNPTPAAAYFTNGDNAFTYYGGPWEDTLFNNAGGGPLNFNRVMTHETGHIFWACDEYASSGCACNVNCYASGPRPLSQNGNCEANCPLNQLCIMKHDDFVLCTYTAVQIGW